MAPPKKDMLSLGRNQMGFMNLFAIPLFQGVADILPAMQYCVDELELNKGLFESAMASEEGKGKEKAPRTQTPQKDDSLSPKTLSFSVAEEASTQTQPVLPELSPPPGLVEHSASDKVGDAASEQVKSVGRPVDGPESSTAYRETNGVKAPFDPVADFGRSDPFSVNSEDTIQGPTKQRCSETTEGSTAPYSGDWASQATSATTGKMPLSPSTQGTSIVSRDSLDRPTSVPVTTVTAPESTTTAPESTKSQPALRLHRSHQETPEQSRAVSLNWGHGAVNGNGTAGRGVLHASDSEQPHNSRTLKKKGSRFKINPMTFFRRHLSSSPPLHAADTADRRDVRPRVWSLIRYNTPRPRYPGQPTSPSRHGSRKWKSSSALLNTRSVQTPRDTGL